MNKKLSRRHFIKLTGSGLALAAGNLVVPTTFRKLLSPISTAEAGINDPYDLYFAGTDGWFNLPVGPTVNSVYHPDALASDPFTNYIFGFRNVTGITDSLDINQTIVTTKETKIQNQKQKAQHNAPFFWVDEFDPNNPKDFRLQLTNLGLELRPDLTDAHTLHWHGFRNVIPYFDGEPTGSISLKEGTVFTYIYRPRDPGTYMYHCHVEDIEHVTMGMNGIVFVRPLQNGSTIGGYNKFAYNDGDGSTGYDREFPMFLSEIWLEGHWNDAHIQESQWYNFKADFSLLNGRVYPDTLLPNSPVDLTANGSAYSIVTQTDDYGDLKTNPGLERLQYQPHSALVTCKEGEKFLLRFANLGFREASMTLAGIKMKVVGRDATPMKGRDRTDTSYETDTLLMGAGESYDAIFTAPTFSGGSGSSGNGYDVYVLYNRRYTQNDDTADGTQGQRTEVRVYPKTKSLVQQHFNDAVIYS